jgi:hypothetical protein
MIFKLFDRIPSCLHASTSARASLCLTSDVSDHPGEAIDEILRPVAFTLGCVEPKGLHGLLIQDPTSASGHKKLLRRSHAMSLLMHPYQSTLLVFLRGPQGKRGANAAFSIGRPKFS